MVDNFKLHERVTIKKLYDKKEDVERSIFQRNILWNNSINIIM
jgi:hypothetical protein